MTTRARATPSILGDTGRGRKRRPSNVNTGHAKGATMYQSGLVTMIITVEAVVVEEALGALALLLPRALPPVVAGGIKRGLGALHQVAVGSEKGPLSKLSSEPSPKVEELCLFSLPNYVFMQIKCNIRYHFLQVDRLFRTPPVGSKASWLWPCVFS